MTLVIVLAFLTKYKKWFIYAGIGIVLLITIFWVKSCFTKEVKIDQEQIQKINSSIEKERKEELRKVIEENSDVIKTVDERNTISETNIKERNKIIEEKVKEADKKIEESKRSNGDVTSEQLECILLPEKCK